jgi:hypothetical protein
VPVAILSSADFDALTVDPNTVMLAEARVKLRSNGTSQASFEDVNGDGLLDLVVHVVSEALELTAADTEAVLQGMAFPLGVLSRPFGGRSIRGVDSVRVVP